MPNLFTLPGPRNGPNNFFTTYEMPPGTSYTVAAGTTIYADLFRVFYSDHNVVGTFDNRGTIWNISTQNVSAGVGGFYIDTILNSGVIIADAPNGNGYGVSVGGYGSLISNRDRSGLSAPAIRSASSITASPWFSTVA